MKRLLLGFSSIFLFVVAAVAQDAKPVRPSSLGISFLLYDYKTPSLIRSSSFSSVRSKDQWTPLGQQSPGLGLHYFTGLTPYIDFAGTLAGTFVRYSVGSEGMPSADRFLMEADASAQFKLFSENYLVTPYLNVGAGVGMYGVYWSAFMPLGAGLKVNLSNESSIFLNFQYRVPVTKQTADYHFVTGIGVTGLLGGGQ